jgi:integrase
MKMASKANGCIQDLGNGKYKLTVSAGFRGTKRIRYYKTIQVKGEKEAQKALSLFVAEIEKGEYSRPNKLLFGDFIKDTWIPNYAEKPNQLSPKTIHRYKEMLNSRIVPLIGDIPFEKLSATDLDSFYNIIRKEHYFISQKKDNDGEKIKSKGISEQTIKHHHRLITSILNYALQKGQIKENPAVRADAPKVRKKDPKCYDEEETFLLLDLLEKAPIKYRTIINIALVSGCRLGEIMGLEWSDIDFKKSTIEIRQASQYIPGQGTFTKDPKTEESKRIIALSPEIMSLIAEYQAVYEKEKSESKNLWFKSTSVFVAYDNKTRQFGKPMHPYTASKWLNKFLKKNNMPPLPFHGLRHTSASLLINQGLNVKAIAARLGHSSSVTTHNIYTHAFKKADQQAADMFNNILNARKSRNLSTDAQ